MSGTLAMATKLVQRKYPPATYEVETGQKGGEIRFRIKPLDRLRILRLHVKWQNCVNAPVPRNPEKKLRGGDSLPIVRTNEAGYSIRRKILEVADGLPLKVPADEKKMRKKYSDCVSLEVSCLYAKMFQWNNWKEHPVFYEFFPRISYYVRGYKEMGEIFEMAYDQLTSQRIYIPK